MGCCYCDTWPILLRLRPVLMAGNKDVVRDFGRI